MKRSGRASTTPISEASADSTVVPRSCPRSDFVRSSAWAAWALTFYGRLLQFTVCGKSKDAAFIDLGDQFIALQEGRRQPGESGRAN
jgi:hypothetical protein